MAPVLFLFLMQAIADMLDKRWPEWEINKMEYRHKEKRKNSSIDGKRFGQPITSKRFSKFEYFMQMYVDDKVFLFETKEELTTAVNQIFEVFSDFGLQMHIGRDGGNSKTELMYFPPSLQKTEYEEINYDEKIPVSNGYVTMTRKFKYLGLWITDDLRATHEVQTQIEKAQAQIGLLYPFFKAEEVPLRIKYMIYCAIPLNTALWGCELWTVTADITRRVESFHRRAILGINMYQVEEFHSKNHEVRKWFMNCPNITQIMMKRQLLWLKKIVNMSDTRAPKRLKAA